MIDILDLGAVGDGKTDNTAILQKALDNLQPKGGMLYFPAGEYVTGSLWVKSNTTIYLEAGAVLAASGEYDLYPVIGEDLIPGFTRGSRRGILFSLNAENITVKGEGTIDGRGYNWWVNRFNGETDEKRPRTIQFINTDNISIEGIRIINSPCWTVHPIHCNNVNIRGISIVNPYDSPNTDGINPESCKNVKISDCYVDVGDDCLTIKSGLERDAFPKAYPCENIVVSNCTFVHGHGGIVIGSEMSGGVRNMTVTNCVFRDTERGIRVKTRRKRGGYVEDIIINNVIMDNVIAGITMNEYYKIAASPDNMELFSYEKRPIEPTTPYFRNIIISNVIMKNVRAAGIYFLGLPELPISKIKILNADIRVTGCAEGEDSVSVHNIPKSYGDGIYLKNVEDVVINNCTLSAKEKEYIFDNAQETYINGKKVPDTLH